jgi:hypothetical protein
VASTTTYQSGDSFVITKEGVSDGTSITLVGAAPGRAQMIKEVCVKTIHALTVVDVTVTKNDTTTVLAKWGATSDLPVGGAVWSLSGPICCAVNDNAVVTFTLAGATAATVAASVMYTLVPA